MCLRTLRNILPRDLAMQLLIKWYVARNAPGPQDLTMNQEWNLFLVIFFTIFGYDINKLYITMSSDVDHTGEHCSPMILSKKQKTINNGSINDWNYLVGSEITNQTQIFLHDAIGICKLKQNDNKDTVSVIESDTTQIDKSTVQSGFVTHLPYILFSLHLLYEEIKLSSNMSESSYLLAKLLYQLSMDFNLPTYKQHYFSDFPTLSKNKTEFLINDVEFRKIVIPDFISSNTPDIFKTLYDLLTLSSVTSYPYILQVNSISKNLIQLFTMFKKQQHLHILEFDHLFKIINQVDNQDKHITSKDTKEIMEEIIMHCYKTGKFK
jgi:anaphase-promoting complex subunit 1